MIKALEIIIVFAILFSSCKEKKKDVEDTRIVLIESPTELGSKQPFLFTNGDQLVMSWTQVINDSVNSVNFSILNETKWTAPIEIVRGKDWFVNWADFPAIAINNENVLTHFLKKSDPATFAYDVHLKMSTNKGQDWNDNFILHTDSTKTEHGFVTMLPYKEDSFFITWLDGRNTGGGGYDDGHGSDGVMNIRTAMVLPSGKIIDDTLVDVKTCDCCQTSAAITPKGPIIVYRDRTDEEVRDIYISRLLDGSWTIPTPIYNDDWIINGCPVNGPKAASYDNTLAVAWFTAADNISKVKIAFSNDSGSNFDTPIQIDSGKPIGRVDIALLDESNALVSWMESTETASEIKIVKVNSNGTKQESVVITTLSAARSSGFPQLEVIDDMVYVAWNNISDNQLNINFKNIPLTTFN